MNLTSSGTLVILITSTGELLLYLLSFSFSFKKKKEKLLQDCFWVALLLLQESIFSGSKILKASNLVQVKWKN